MTEADALVIGQFVSQRADFDVFGLDEFGIPFHLFDQRLNQRRHLGFGGRFQIELIEFGEWIHRSIIPPLSAESLDMTEF